MTKKLTDEQFLSILRDNAGLYSYTAKAISQKYGIKFSRQAATERAKKHPEVVTDIREETLDRAEFGLQSMMEGDDSRIKLQAITLFLKTIGKSRGYIEKQETDLSVNPPMVITLSKADELI